MNAEGLGTKLIDQPVEQDLAETRADVYGLTLERLLTLNRMGEKSAEKLLGALEQSFKKTTLTGFMYALGICDVGEAAALALAENFISLDDLLEADEERLEQVPDIGPVVATKIRMFGVEPHNRESIQRLIERKVHWPENETSLEALPLAGRKGPYWAARIEACRVAKQFSG
jgi:DNA ligase (NAD+)